MSETINRTKLQQFIANVDQEVLNMLSGEGTKRPGTLHFEAGKNSCPVMNRWEIFKETPTSANLTKFIELAKQDFGGPTGELFEGQSQAIFTVEKVVSRPTPKAFDVSVKDAFYDMFKTARIPMEPKQVERIEAIALKLAAVFDKKVSDAVAAQLGALVKSLKKKEEETVVPPTVPVVVTDTPSPSATVDEDKD